MRFSFGSFLFSEKKSSSQNGQREKADNAYPARPKCAFLLVFFFSQKRRVVRKTASVKKQTMSIQPNQNALFFWFFSFLRKEE